MLTQSVTPTTADNAPTGASTSEIPESYDAKGLQQVEDGVFDFDAPASEAEPQHDVTTITETTSEEVVEPGEPKKDPEPTTDPIDPNKPAEPAKPAEPKEPELTVYAGKFNSVQDLKNSFVELGGDPAEFGDDVKQLEQAYLVRQREYSRVRAEINHINQTPAEPIKTYEEMVKEEFSKYDPTKFKGPQDMWEAQIAANAAAAARFEQQQTNNRQPQITPQEMDRQIKIVNNLNTLESKVPRLKTDKNFRNTFALHVRQMRDEGRLKTNPDGTQNLIEAMKDFLEGQTAVVAEAQRAFQQQQDAKELSTTTASDNGGTNPATAPRKTANDSLVDELVSYHTELDRKYNAGR